MRSNIPSLQDFQDYQVNRAGEPEVIRNSLYDFNLYPTAGQTQINFFQTPQGAGNTTSTGATAGTPKTIQDTNMELAGQLPNPKGFMVESIEVDAEPGSVSTANTFTLQVVYSFLAVAAQTFIPGVAANDVHAILGAGELQFFIGSKPYLDEAPLKRFPPKARWENDAAIANNSATTAEVGVITFRSGGRPYFLQPPVSLMATQNFKVSLNWSAVVATPSGFNARVGVILDGYLFRNSQ